MTDDTEGSIACTENYLVQSLDVVNDAVWQFAELLEIADGQDDNIA